MLYQGPLEEDALNEDDLVAMVAETLIHATGQIRSDKERGIIISGYAPRMYPRANAMLGLLGFNTPAPAHRVHYDNVIFDVE